MTEAEWRACRDPTALLKFLLFRLNDRGPARRKLRLFAAACCRRLWPALTDARSRRAVEVLEQFADGRVTQEVFWQARREAERAMATSHACLLVRNALSLPWVVSLSDELNHEGTVARAEQCRILHELCDNPHRPGEVPPEWLAWNGRTLPQLAQAIYDERAFDRLPVLADALEEAGCTDADLLAHCRAPGPHVRGCWAVDLLLGKA